MFEADRDELLAIASFHANNTTLSPTTWSLQAVEVWKYAGVETCNENNFRHITLGDDQIRPWLAQEGQFTPLKPDQQDAVLECAIRILFCVRTDYRPPGFGMSQESFLAVSKQFNLPISTLSSIFNYQGTFSRNTRYSSTTPEKLQRIGLTIKAPQKMPIADYCLSLSHDYSTRTTTAFIHGQFLHTTLPSMCLSILSEPLSYSHFRRHHDFAASSIPDNGAHITQSFQMISRLQSSVSHWGHPLLLPILLLRNYMFRSNLFAWDLHDQVVALERQTGVVFAGRTVTSFEGNIDPEKIPRNTIKTMTKDMHTLLTEIIFFERVVTWLVDCGAFLEKAVKEMNEDGVEVEGQDKNVRRRADREILELLESVGADATSLCGMQKSLKERVQSQINVLYSFIAQIDNSINAKIAVSSARDSSAMKTLALITTVFLPGTYVATLFSMSMFSWSQPSSTSDGTSVMSHKFWIYWAVTIPLTLLTIVVWRLWWLWQERSYQKEVKEAVGAAGNEDEASSTESHDYDASTGMSPDLAGRTRLGMFLRRS